MKLNYRMIQKDAISSVQKDGYPAAPMVTVSVQHPQRFSFENGEPLKFDVFVTINSTERVVVSYSLSKKQAKSKGFVNNTVSS